MNKTFSVIAIFTYFTLFLNLPVLQAAQPEEPEIVSETAVLMEAGSGQILFTKEMHKQMEPASVTKLMTALLAVENDHRQDVITMSREAVFSVPRWTSHIALDDGEQLSLEQALYAMMVESANDAANGIAEYLGGSLDNFAQLMNRRAEALGAQNTHFANAHGLPVLGHFTSAYDLALIVQKAISYPEFLAYSNVPVYDMAPTNKQIDIRHFHNTHAMIRPRPGLNYPYPGVISGKTGYTSETGYTLVTVVQQGEYTLIGVVLKSRGAKDAYQDTIKLFDYGWAKLADMALIQPGEQLSTSVDDSTSALKESKDRLTIKGMVVKVLKLALTGMLSIIGLMFIIRWTNLYRRRRKGYMGRPRL